MGLPPRSGIRIVPLKKSGAVPLIPLLVERIGQWLIWLEGTVEEGLPVP